MAENRMFLFHNTNYSTEELKEIVETANISKYDNSYLGIPVYKIFSTEKLPGETFRPFNLNSKYTKSNLREIIKIIKDFPKIEISNLGRVKINDKIQKQYQKEYGWLYVELLPKFEYEVYRLVAETWVQCPVEDTLDNIIDKNYWTVHHINNNGFDNRPHNLIWLSLKEHGFIDPYPIERKELLINTLLEKIKYFTKKNILNDESIEVFIDLCLLYPSKENHKAIIREYIDKLNLNQEKYPEIKWDKLK